MPGLVLGWGKNDSGEVGDGSGVLRSSPVHVRSVIGAGVLTDVRAISASRHCLALKSDGRVVGWGDNTEGAVGDGSKDIRWAPVYVRLAADEGDLTHVKAVSASRLTPSYTSHSLALEVSGKVRSWGYNGNGELGLGNNAPPELLNPTYVPVLSDIVQVSAGTAYSLALHADGRVSSWGSNLNGQLGNGTNNPTSPTPGKVQDGSGDLGYIKSVSAGGHSLALRWDGTVMAWGPNGEGQLGNGAFSLGSNVAAPVKAPADGQPGGGNYLRSIVAVSAGYRHSLALRSDGTVLAWGENDDGRLGDGTKNVNRNLPVQVKNFAGTPAFLTGIVAVSAGYYASAALRYNGRVATWGGNQFGQLGTGKQQESMVPVLASNLADAIAISMGVTHGLALV